MSSGHLTICTASSGETAPRTVPTRSSMRALEDIVGLSMSSFSFSIVAADIFFISDAQKNPIREHMGAEPPDSFKEVSRSLL